MWSPDRRHPEPGPAAGDRRRPVALPGRAGPSGPRHAHTRPQAQPGPGRRAAAAATPPLRAKRAPPTGRRAPTSSWRRSGAAPSPLHARSHVTPAVVVSFLSSILDPWRDTTTRCGVPAAQAGGMARGAHREGAPPAASAVVCSAPGPSYRTGRGTAAPVGTCSPALAFWWRRVEALQPGQGLPAATGAGVTRGVKPPTPSQPPPPAWLRGDVRAAEVRLLSG
jgi:hypothetical protein